MKTAGRRIEPIIYLLAVGLFLIGAGFFISEAHGEERAPTIIQQISNEFTRIAEKANPAVVFIHVEKTMKGGRGMGLSNQFSEEFFRRFFGDRMPPV